MPRQRGSAQHYVDGITACDRAVLARAITLVESEHPSDALLAQEVIEGCLPFSGRSVRVGITGVPGAGKSTFIEALGTHLIEVRGERVAVLSVDPSSQVSGGSILGDKTRMERLGADERAFIRPSPTRGQLGGVTRHTREAILICEAAGFGNILVETVGVGQSETAVRGMTDFFLLLMLAGAGDELQGIKRGVLELVDLVAVNKADGDNRARAEVARRELANALHLFPASDDGWTPPVVTCSALSGEGVPMIWDLVRAHRGVMQTSGEFAKRRARQRVEWLHDLIRQTLEAEFRRRPGVSSRLQEAELAVRQGAADPISAAARVFRNADS
ncbi:MAG: methylmalonyl Co-A mutase-associated GTPase MeaB [Bryobacteraceae bacterium]